MTVTEKELFEIIENRLKEIEDMIEFCKNNAFEIKKKLDLAKNYDERKKLELDLWSEESSMERYNDEKRTLENVRDKLKWSIKWLERNRIRKKVRNKK